MSSNQRVQAILLGLFLVFALVLASCAPAAGVEVTSARIQAWVGGPRDGVEVPMGQVPVLCHAFARAGVAQIELWVNGAFTNRAVNTAPGETYFTAELSFEATGPGRYVLECLTGDQDGETVRSEPVTVTVGGEEPAPAATPPEIPTATPTSTEVPPPVAPPPPTATQVPPTATRIPPTATRIPPTSTPPPPTSTPPPPMIVSFEVVKSDGCFHFTWAVEGVISAVWFDGEGVGDHDSRDRCPTATRAYELRAEGPGGTDTESVTVVVTPGDTEGPVIGRFAHSPGLIYWDEYDTCGPPTYPVEVAINAYNITDPSGVSAVKVVYRVVEAGRPAGQWQAKPMNQVQTGMYSASIGANDLELSLNPPVSYGYGNQSTLEYYIQAFDGVGNRSDSSTRTLIVQYCVIIT